VWSSSLLMLLAQLYNIIQHIVRDDKCGVIPFIAYPVDEQILISIIQYAPRERNHDANLIKAPIHRKHSPPDITTIEGVRALGESGKHRKNINVSKILDLAKALLPQSEIPTLICHSHSPALPL